MVARISRATFLFCLACATVTLALQGFVAGRKCSAGLAAAEPSQRAAIKFHSLLCGILITVAPLLWQLTYRHYNTPLRHIMSGYDNDGFQDPWRNARDNRPPPPPYPTPSAYDGGPAYGGMPPPPAGGPPQGTEVPPPPMGEQLNRRPSALKREGSRSRVPHLQPQFPDEASYLGSKAPDLERKNRPRDKQFRDKRDGYESDEGETLRKSKPRGDNFDEPDPRKRGARDAYNDRQRDPYGDQRPPPRRGGYDDDEPPPPRRRRDRDYDDEPPPRQKRRDQPGVEYGSDPVPAVRRSNTERPGRSQKSRRDYDDDESSEDDRRRPPPRRRSQDDTRRRRRDYDDDRDDRGADRRRRDDRDRYGDDRRRDKSRDRGRYDDDDDYYDSRRDRDRRDRRRGSSAPPKEIKIGDYDVGPWVEKGKKSYGAIAPILTPLVINMARKYMRDKKR